MSADLLAIREALRDARLNLGVAFLIAKRTGAWGVKEIEAVGDEVQRIEQLVTAAMAMEHDHAS